MASIRTSLTRVQEQTSPELNERIKEQIQANVAYYAAHREAINQRLAELDNEWDIERRLQANSAAISLLGLGLAATRGLKWLAIPLAVQSFFLQHGVQGWCPPLPVLRRLGVRTASEIEIERQALKALRGDFQQITESTDAAETLKAVASNGSASVAPSQAAFTRLNARRVPDNTSASINAQIQNETERRVTFYRQHPEVLDRHLTDLSREWDIERVIETEAPSLTLSGILLTLVGGRKWLALPLFAQAMMLVHAFQGYYPLVPFFRRLGLRTEEEIAHERYALKATRGDFGRVTAQSEPGAGGKQADAAFEAANPGRQAP